MSKRAKIDKEPSKPSRNKRDSPSTSKNDTRRNQSEDKLWYCHDEDISQTIETPEEESARLKRQKLETSEIHIELELDHDKLDYDSEVPDYQEDPKEVQIKVETQYDLEEEAGYVQTEDGYEQDRETDVETEDESAEASPQRRVVVRSKGKMTKNMRRAKRKKIQRDQATKSALLRLGDNANKETHGRSRTPSTEIMSDENALSRANRRKISPESTAAIQRKDRNWMRVLDKSGTLSQAQEGGS